jgi:transposase
MAMSKRSGGEKQEDIWIAHTELAVAPGHPFYKRLNELLEGDRFDEFVEGLCARFYHARLGRPSLRPGIYFRALLVGYFEGIDSERGIAWRVADSLALRGFLLIGLDERTPDHSTISRTRRLIDIDTHREVFAWVLGLLAERGLLKGQRMGIDATTLEANAAMRSIVRRDTGETYEEFLRGLAKASGIETPTREDLARLDRKRPEAHVEQRVEESGRRGRADHEDERRADALGAQSRTRGGSGHGCHRGRDAASRRPG